jgi:hypothetical protein
MRLRRARTPLDEMHRLLGEFLTECGRVECLIVIFADDISIEAIFHDLSGPLGPKIAAFNCRNPVEKSAKAAVCLHQRPVDGARRRRAYAPTHGRDLGS